MNIPNQSAGVVVITGATGFIGSYLASYLMERGYTVRTVTRSDWSGYPYVPVGNRFFGNLPAQIPSEAFEGADAVVHCAAVTGGSQKAVYAINLHGTSAVADLAEAHGVTKFIYLSSQSSKPDAISDYGVTKYLSEQDLLKREKFDCVILRPGLVTGEGSRGLYQRMCNVVKSLPVIPILGSGNAIVQPVHVEDLCRAMELSIEKCETLNKSILNIGNVEGVSLLEFLKTIAEKHLGKKKAAFKIPLFPIEIGVAVAETLRIPLPVNRNNIKGMKTVTRMETAGDLETLGLQLRTIEESVTPVAFPFKKEDEHGKRAVRVIIVGTGRIALVHAVTLSRLEGAQLVGYVDKNPKAAGLLIGMGVKAPVYSSVADAVTALKPDAAVISTPTATHFAIAKECLENGLSVLLEKPLAIRDEQYGEYRALAARYPNQSLLVGYFMPRTPHAVHAIERLKRGDFGKVKGFFGLTLLSFVQAPGMKRWEFQKEVSGGGVYINSGGHILSVIHSAFGKPVSITAEQCKKYSTEIEDSLIARFRYPEFEGVHYCSWSIDGFPRQENRFVVETDTGQLILCGSMAIFIRNDGTMEYEHQLDSDSAFNMAPDYWGGGYSRELLDLIHAVRTGESVPTNLENAIELETMLKDVYRSSTESDRFTRDFSIALQSPANPTSAVATNAQSGAVKRILDLRELKPVVIRQIAGRLDGWDGVQVMGDQLRALPTEILSRGDVRVTVPDFLTQSRLLSLGRFGEVLKQMGAAGFIKVGFAGVGAMMSEHKPTFWVAATGMLGAGLNAVPKSFSGTVLLHPSLVDLALCINRLDMLDKMLAYCRKQCPNAKVGFHTTRAADALNALYYLGTSVDAVSMLVSPNDSGLEILFSDIRKAAGNEKIIITAETGPVPAMIQRAAMDNPQCWAHNADAILINSSALESVQDQRAAAVKEEWSKAFTGVECPDFILTTG